MGLDAPLNFCDPCETIFYPWEAPLHEEDFSIILFIFQSFIQEIFIKKNEQKITFYFELEKNGIILRSKLFLKIAW